MKNVVFYNANTGAITGSSSCQDEVLVVETRPYIEVSVFDPQYPQTHWVSNGALANCSALSLTWDNTAKTLSGLPNPSVVRVDYTPYTVTDGVAEFAGMTGNCVLRVESVGYLRTEMSVTL